MRKPLAVGLSVLGVLCIAAGLMLAQRPTMLFIADTRYVASSFSLKERLSLYRTTIRNGWVPAVETIPVESLSDPGAVETFIRNSVNAKASPLVILSPLVTAAVSSDEPLFPSGSGPHVVGMGSFAIRACFDVALVARNPDEGWISAAMALRQRERDTPLPTALLYAGTDGRAAADAETFADALDSDALVLFPQDSSKGSLRQAQADVKRMKALGVLTVVSPYAGSLAAYVGDPLGEGLQWVVDADYGPAIPSGQLLGTVGDDLAASVVPLFSAAKAKAGRGPTIILPLARVYREAGKGLRNWF